MFKRFKTLQIANLFGKSVAHDDNVTSAPPVEFIPRDAHHQITALMQIYMGMSFTNSPDPHYEYLAETDDNFIGRLITDKAQARFTNYRLTRENAARVRELNAQLEILNKKRSDMFSIAIKESSPEDFDNPFSKRKRPLDQQIQDIFKKKHDILKASDWMHIEIPLSPENENEVFCRFSHIDGIKPMQIHDAYDALKAFMDSYVPPSPAPQPNLRDLGTLRLVDPSIEE